MEYNHPSELIKELNFGQQAKDKIIAGVDKLAQAVKSTLGASGKCVIYEDARGNPVITKDGVTVAESVVLYDPVENLGATLIKQAAQNTVKEAGDGTTTATVLAEALIKEVNKEEYKDISIRDIKNGINSALDKVNTYLTDTAIDVEGSMLEDVSSISCNNDRSLGIIIAEAYEKVGEDGVVFMETSETEKTYADIVDGVQFDCGITSPHFVTDTEKHEAVLEEPLVLIVGSKIPNIRKIQTILEHVIKNKKELLIVAEVDQQLKSALMMNKVKGNIKVNIIDLPGFGPTKQDTIQDLAFLTGATVINEELGDDMDLITVDCLGKAKKAVTNDKNTVITTIDLGVDLQERIENVKKAIKSEKNGYLKKKIQDRLAMLSGKVGVVKVGAASKVELKEKKDRVEDAIYATKAALKEGIVPGGGIALLNAAQELATDNSTEKILLNAIKAPYNTILDNAGIYRATEPIKGVGINVKDNNECNMIQEGIIDPVLVTKSALKNAVSVVTTIISADCIISNMRGDASSQ
uniref:Chaperonin GroEL n=1 Tax=uncultured virus TaxID=340016 RepID=A0A219YK67_9VIRU|nr:chaperonin GroEL [uncultured virus]